MVGFVMRAFGSFCAVVAVTRWDPLIRFALRYTKKTRTVSSNLNKHLHARRVIYAACTCAGTFIGSEKLNNVLRDNGYKAVGAPENTQTIPNWYLDLPKYAKTELYRWFNENKCSILVVSSWDIFTESVPRYLMIECTTYQNIGWNTFRYRMKFLYNASEKESNWFCILFYFLSSLRM
jgi:hypothetical protein